MSPFSACGGAQKRSGSPLRLRGGVGGGVPTNIEPEAASSDTRWQFFGATIHPFALALHDALKGAFGDSKVGGVVVILPDLSYDPDMVQALLSASHTALLASAERETRFVLVQQGRVGGAFARTLHLESPQIATYVVTVPFDRPESDGSLPRHLPIRAERRFFFAAVGVETMGCRTEY